jgi:hypothetical protein
VHRLSLLLLALFATTLVASGARAQEDASAAEDVEAPAPETDPPSTTEPESSEGEPGVGEELPDALPPLDSELLDMLGDTEPAPEAPDPLRGVTLVGHGRMRFEVDDSRDRLAADDLQAGIVFTGRLGIAAPLGEHRTRIVIGDGRRVGQDLGTLPHPIVDPMALGLLYTALLDLDLQLLGLPSRLELGRQPLAVADGRWIGRADFDARGRTFDGALVRYDSDLLFARAGVLYLGPLVPGDFADPSGLALVHVGTAQPAYQLDGYAFVHRDGTPARVADPNIVAATLGGRASATFFGLTARAGLDGQLPTTDDAPLSPVGWGAHAEGALRYGPTLSLFDVMGAPFVELSAEWTGGAPVGGLRFRAPGPTVHPFLGVLDIATADNVASAALALGITTEDGLLLSTEARALFLADATGALLDPTGRAVIAADATRTESHVLNELDARVRIPAANGAAHIDLEYGVGFAGAAFAGGTMPIQRLLVGVTFDLDLAR